MRWTILADTSNKVMPDELMAKLTSLCSSEGIRIVEVVSDRKAVPDEFDIARMRPTKG
jgi:hypothetical protein